jgi:hypothetical protein
MNKFYSETTLPTPILDYKSLWPNAPADISDTIPRWQQYPLNIARKTLWNEEIRSQLASQGLTPTLVRIFRWCPKGRFTWHIDGTTKEITSFAINWILEGEGVIQWNSKLKLPPPPSQHNHLAYGSVVGTDHDPYEEETGGHGCLVNTAIPHRVLNNNNIHRISLSIQFGNQLTYEQALEKLSTLGYIK